MSCRYPVRQLLLCSLFAALCAVGAFIKIPLAWLPITLQTFFSTLAGLLLGKKWGTLPVAVYLAMGLIGFPVFTQGGGIMYVLKPSFGFLLALLPATYLTGALAQVWPKTVCHAFFSSLAGALMVYLVGLPYFYAITTLYLGQSLTIWPLLCACFFPTLPGDVLKCVVCALTVGKLRAALPNN